MNIYWHGFYIQFILRNKRNVTAHTQMSGEWNLNFIASVNFLVKQTVWLKSYEGIIKYNDNDQI